ncbi:MAG TPA: alpha/beta hydrolase-fold protein, partial [Thermoanaerobaculia bacterium]|nr:alpha/beta hydrolase-fold protein [Thermoanaerobaculia bacterium]
MRRGVFAVLFLGELASGCVSSRVTGVPIERFATASLPEPAKVLVLLPPSYSTEAARRYPVLYFLHDGYGNSRTLQTSGVAAALERRMAEGVLPEFVIVAP